MVAVIVVVNDARMHVSVWSNGLVVWWRDLTHWADLTSWRLETGHCVRNVRARFNCSLPNTTERKRCPKWCLQTLQCSHSFIHSFILSLSLSFSFVYGRTFGSVQFSLPLHSWARASCRTLDSRHRAKNTISFIRFIYPFIHTYYILDLEFVFHQFKSPKSVSQPINSIDRTNCGQMLSVSISCTYLKVASHLKANNMWLKCSRIDPHVWHVWMNVWMIIFGFFVYLNCVCSKKCLCSSCVLSVVWCRVCWQSAPTTSTNSKNVNWRFNVTSSQFAESVQAVIHLIRP